MNLSSNFVGTPFKPFRKTIHWRDTMNYAAAIDDSNDAYFDDESDAGGIVAPPMFPVAVTWPIIEQIGDFIDSTDFPLDLLATMVHYTEHIHWHERLIPGNILSIAGEIAAIMPHRAGTHVVIKFAAAEINSQKPVFTEHVGALLRGVECGDAGRGNSRIPKISAAAPAEGEIWESTLYIDPMRPFVYDGCTNIVFPIHTSKKFAHKVGLPGIIVQGTATMAFAVREIVNREASGRPSRVSQIFGRFTGMVMPGTHIRVVLYQKNQRPDGIDLQFSVLNESGQKSITDGYIFLTND